MTEYQRLLINLKNNKSRWLITGVAGFIGSNLLENLLKLDQIVIGLDNLSTGFQRNLDEVRDLVTPEQWRNFYFFHGDIRDINTCNQICKEIDYVLHQAALGSVPRSILDPISTNQNNIDGFLNMLVAAKDANVKRFVFASSSSTYGDSPDLPKVEDRIGNPLSPYAVTKRVNELYASVFSQVYKLECIGLRYFNVFGPRQDPNGAYAAVIPKWIASILKNEVVYINGDGQTSRDFCYVDNAVQANLLAALSVNNNAINTIYNVAVGEQTSLNEIQNILRSVLSKITKIDDLKPIYREFRSGDIRHSHANISKIKDLLGYQPSHNVMNGLEASLAWYVNFMKTN